MPQLDLSFFLENILFTIGSFGLFYFLITYFILRKYFKLKKKRQAFIEKIKSKIEENIVEIDSIKKKLEAKEVKHQTDVLSQVEKIDKKIRDYRKLKEGEVGHKQEILARKVEGELLQISDDLNQEVDKDFDRLKKLVDKF